MKVLCDTMTGGYSVPVSKAGLSRLKTLIPAGLAERIRTLRFGCNTRTTQEGRIVQHGSVYDIRINFCLKDNCSVLLSTDKEYCNEIRSFGGEIDMTRRMVRWKDNNAERYAMFILLHEIAHIAYSIDKCAGRMSGRTSSAEEQWCTEYAMSLLDRWSRSP